MAHACVVVCSYVFRCKYNHICSYVCTDNVDAIDDAKERTW